MFVGVAAIQIFYTIPQFGELRNSVILYVYFSNWFDMFLQIVNCIGSSHSESSITRMSGLYFSVLR
jgi:hypothetical protein